MSEPEHDYAVFVNAMEGLYTLLSDWAEHETELTDPSIQIILLDQVAMVVNAWQRATRPVAQTSRYTRIKESDYDQT